MAAEKDDNEIRTEELSSEKVDAYRAIINSNLPDREKEPDRVGQEVLTFLVAGSATTMKIMTRIVYHVHSTPQVLQKLRRELNTVMPGLDVHPELETLEQQQYLVSMKCPKS